MPNQTNTFSLTTTGSTAATGIGDLPQRPEQSMSFWVFSGTYGTVAVKFQATVDGTNYFDVGAIKESDLTIASGTLTLTDNATTCYMVSAAGYSNVRVYVTAIASGTLAVTALATNVINVPLSVSNVAGNTSAGNTAIAGTLTVTSASASALTVGRLGSTTPALQVDASTATSITGVKIKSAASGNGVAISTIGETNVALTIDAAGSGTIAIGATSTGAVTITPATTITGAVTCSSTLSCTALTATSIAATGTVALTNNMTITAAKNIILDATTGSKIGTATTQKLGFFNSTPVVQPVASTDTSTGAAGSTTSVYLNTTFNGAGSAAYTIGGVVLSLKALGLLAA